VIEPLLEAHLASTVGRETERGARLSVDALSGGDAASEIGCGAKLGQACCGMAAAGVYRRRPALGDARRARGQRALILVTRWEKAKAETHRI